MDDPLEDIFYLLPTESLSDILKDSNLDFDILLPVQMPEGTDSSNFSVAVHFSLDDVFSAILKILLHDPFHINIEYYKQLLLSYKPAIKEDLLSSAMQKMEEKDFFSAEIFFKILLELTEEGEDISFITYNLTISLETQVNLFIYLERKQEAQEKLKELKVLYHSFSDQVDNSNKNDLDRLMSFNRVQEMISQNREEEALIELDKIIEEENSWEVWFFKGWILRKLKKYQLAIEAFQESSLLSQPTVDLLMEEFICFFQLENYQESKRVLEMALSLDKEDSRIYFNFGLLLYRLGEALEALSWFKKGLIYDPNDSMAIDFIEIIQNELKSES